MRMISCDLSAGKGRPKMDMEHEERELKFHFLQIREKICVDILVLAV